jgi:hypothetical protein
MREDTILRFRLAGELSRMCYGDSRRIPRDDALSAWPPTGNEDRSMEGAFRAMALAFGGNRPELDLTTEDRIRRDLDESFDIQQHPEHGDWVIHRRMRACPHCRGSGVVRQWPAYSVADFDPNAKLAMDEVVTVETKPCDHKPA